VGCWWWRSWLRHRSEWPRYLLRDFHRP